MPTQKTLREILEGLLGVIAGASQIAIDRNADSGVIDFREPIDKATSEIKSLLKEKLPKKLEGKECSIVQIYDDEKSFCSECERIEGSNQTLTEIEKILEEL